MGILEYQAPGRRLEAKGLKPVSLFLIRGIGNFSKPT